MRGRRHRLWSCLAAMLLLMTSSGAFSDMIQADIVVVGGSFSAPAAALQAARQNPSLKVLLVEPMDWLGGQATSQGVSAIDNAWHNPGATLMRENPELYYASDYLDFLDRMRNPGAGAPGEGLSPNGTSWVSREAFDPRTGAWVLEQMVSELPNLTLMKLSVVKDVTTVPVNDQHGSGLRITRLQVIQRTPINDYEPFDKFLSEEIEDWYSTADSAIYTKEQHTIVPNDDNRGMVVIDGSELGDVIVLSDAVYTVGRERTTEEIADNGTLPEYNEESSQAFVFVFAMTDAAALDDEAYIGQQFADFDTYYNQQKSSYFSMGSHSWVRIWTYRRLFTSGPSFSFDTAYSGDVSMQNWFPGNDYPYSGLYKTKAQAAAEASDWKGGILLPALAEAEKHAVAWYYYMKENRTSSFDTKYLDGNHPKNMMGTATGLARFPYIRGTRRIVGLDNFRMRERELVDVDEPNRPATSFRYYDSVGIGNYAVDIHPIQGTTGISPTVHKPAPFYFPYRSLGSVNVRNLLASGKTMAQTYITNSAYRLHPIEWASGTAAGTAAAMMAEDGASNYDLLAIGQIRELQNRVRTTSPIHWDAYDEDAIPSNDGDLIVNDLNTIQNGVPFRVEAYHPTAARAVVYLDDLYSGEQQIGETEYRANGRLVLNNATAPAGSTRFRAELYNGQGNHLTTLRNYKETDLSIVDNDEPRFSTTGSWTTGSAQADRYGASYAYKFGNSGAGTATWDVYTPNSGMYEVYVWYPASSNRASDSPYTIHHAGGTTTVRVDQTTNGGRWVHIGDFQFNGGTDSKIVLSNDIADTSKLVVADAVRVVPKVSSQWILTEKGNRGKEGHKLADAGLSR